MTPDLCSTSALVYYSKCTCIYMYMYIYMFMHVYIHVHVHYIVASVPCLPCYAHVSDTLQNYFLRTSVKPHVRGLCIRGGQNYMYMYIHVHVHVHVHVT